MLNVLPSVVDLPKLIMFSFTVENGSLPITASGSKSVASAPTAGVGLEKFYLHQSLKV